MSKTKTRSSADRVRTIIAEMLCVDLTEVTPGASLNEHLGADSIDFVEVCMSIEEAFHLNEISDADAEKLLTVQSIIDYVDAHAEA